MEPSAPSIFFTKVSWGRPEKLGETRGHRAGVAVGRLDPGDHEVEGAGLGDGRGQNPCRRQRIGAPRGRRR